MNIFMQRDSKVGIVCCSNGQGILNKETIELLQQTLLEIGLTPVFSDCIYAKESVFSGTARERAEALMNFYQNEEIKVIFDISGGDIANEILPYLDFDVIAEADKQFWGYSDLTTIINAIYAKTGKESVLYQVKNLVSGDSKRQIANFTDYIFAEKKDVTSCNYESVQKENRHLIENERTQNRSLFSFAYEFVQKESMQGILVGGNIRCLLKLAGTPYFPEMNKKVLLLEARSGEVPQMVTYLNQLKQMGVFEKINGILLGTFTAMEKKQCVPCIETLVKEYAGCEIPIAITKEIGHGVDSKAIVIGKSICL